MLVKTWCKAAWGHWRGWREKKSGSDVDAGFHLGIFHSGTLPSQSNEDQEIEGDARGRYGAGSLEAVMERGIDAEGAVEGGGSPSLEMSLVGEE